MQTLEVIFLFSLTPLRKHVIVDVMGCQAMEPTNAFMLIGANYLSTFLSASLRWMPSLNNLTRELFCNLIYMLYLNRKRFISNTKKTIIVTLSQTLLPGSQELRAAELESNTELDSVGANHFHQICSWSSNR